MASKLSENALTALPIYRDSLELPKHISEATQQL